MIFDEEVRQLHNMISDIEELMFTWSRSNKLFKGSNVHKFIVEWDSIAV